MIRAITRRKPTRDGHIDYRRKDKLFGSKAEIFLKLFKAIAEDVGGTLNAQKVIGMAGSTCASLYKGEISTHEAEKILTAYKATKASK